MPASREGREPTPSDTGRHPLTREMIFLAQQAAEGGLRALPGQGWGLHYPVDPETRGQRLQELLNGERAAEEIAHELTPDALTYDVEDIASQGLEQVSARIRDLSASVAHFDYPRYARFIESMRGREIPLGELDHLYASMTGVRTQKRMLDAYGRTGRQQLERALDGDARRMLQSPETRSRSQRVLDALKIDWLCEEQHLVTPEDRDRCIASLSGDERSLYNRLAQHFRGFIETGTEEEYAQLLQGVQEDWPRLQSEPDQAQASEEMERLEQELEPLKDRVGPPGTPEDPAIPPEDSDEYHTPPVHPGESKEQVRARPIFEIEPPLKGYYASGRKSYFDPETRTWSKRKQLAPYAETPAGKERCKISGNLDTGLKSLPLPNGYAIDAGSLAWTGERPQLWRDQNGCFYLEAKGAGTFTAEFVREDQPFVGPPVPEDTAPLHRGTVSAKTDAAIGRLIGTPLQKAEQARQYLLANHFYPGGGDLESAQALQYKIRAESTAETYLPNLDQSEYLECYSANTLYIAMLRKAGVPARLVIGHHVESAQDGRTAITENTGHAWTEIWDGTAWRRFDATPPPKPEDKKPETEQASAKQESAPEADDGGVDRPRPPGQARPESGQPSGQPSPSEPEMSADQSEKSAPEGQPSGKPGGQMTDASDADLSEAESQLQQAQEQMERVNEQRKQLQEQAQQIQKFQDVEDLKQQVEQSDLFDDLKEELRKLLEAKERQMKGEITDELDTMADDGFLDEERRDQLHQELADKTAQELDRIREALDRENRLYHEYDDLRQEVRPLVEEWFRFFAERLPRHEEVERDEDSLNRQGAFNRRSVMRPRNLLFGTVKNPRQIRPSVRPRFLTSLLVDVSGSMAGEKLRNARKLLVFYAELFSRISEAFGYIRTSIDIFSDGVTTIKDFDQDYDSPRRYDFGDGPPSTVKLRLMERLKTQGGTNMLTAVQKAAGRLNEERHDYPEYASAMYFFGDGGDTHGNAASIRNFLKLNDAEHGFGEHLYTATLLGDESQRKDLASIFGDDHTNVAPDFDELVRQSMEKFSEDIEAYLRDKTQ